MEHEEAKTTNSRPAPGRHPPSRWNKTAATLIHVLMLFLMGVGALLLPAVGSAQTMHTVTLTNEVIGFKAESGYNTTNKTFTTTLSCGAGNAWLTWTAELVEGQVATYSVPDGYKCYVSVDSEPALPNTSYSWFDDENAPNDVTITKDTVFVINHDIELATVKELRIFNVFTGDGEGYIEGGNLKFTIDCGAAGVRTLLTPANNTSARVPILPGSMCHVTQTVLPGVIETGYTSMATIWPSTFTVTDDMFVYAYSRVVQGTIAKGTMAVTKTVTGAAKPQGHDASRDFGFEVSCTGEKFGAVSFELFDGQSATVEAELGKTCAVSEGGAPFFPANPGYQYAVSVTPSSVIVASANAVAVENKVVSDGTMHTVTVTNEVIGFKAESGYNTTNKTFTTTLDCGPGYTWTVALVEGQVATYSVPNGYQCYAESSKEPELPNGDYWFDVSDSFDTVIKADTNFVITHNIGSPTESTIAVYNSVQGAYGADGDKYVNGLAGFLSGGRFAVTVDCGPGWTRTTYFDRGGPIHYISVPAGSKCSVTQTVLDGTIEEGYTNLATINPSAFVASKGEYVFVEVNNWIEHRAIAKGTITVTKTVTGAAKPQGYNVETWFEFNIDCPGMGGWWINTGNSHPRIYDSQSATVEAELGQTCAVSEAYIPSANPGYKYISTVTPSSVIVANATSVAVENQVVSEGANVPVLSAQSLSNITSTGASFGVTSNSAATAYWVVRPASDPAPTAAQIVAQAGANTGAMAASTAFSRAITGLTAGTAYQLHFVASNAQGYSAVWSAPFTTTSVIYTITASAGAGGAISPAGATRISSGLTQTFTLTPNAGYGVSSVGGTCGGTLSGNTFTTKAVTANCTVTASFAVYPTVTANAGAGGAISPAGATRVAPGTTQTFTVTPNAGYRINTVTGCNGTLSGNTYTTGPVTANCTVSASFAVYPTVTASAGAGGTISPTGAVRVAPGTTQTFTLTPNAGYSIASVGGTCNGTLSGNTFTTGAITANCTVAARFAVYPTVTASAGAGGTISPSGATRVAPGTTQTFTLTPNAGYKISTVGGTCGGTLSGNAFTTKAVAANCTVTAAFVRQ